MPAIDQSGMRRVNTGATLRVLADARGATTTADLVSHTRLSRRTIELILAELIDAGWAREVDAPEPTKSAGRPRKYYEFVADREVVVSIVIDGESARAAVADMRGSELARAEHPIVDPGEPAHVLALALDVTEQALAEAGHTLDRVRAVVVGVGGTLSSDGRVLTSPVGERWAGTDVATPFRVRFACPVHVENDMNLAALAEHATGAVRDAETFVLLTPGNRVSAGVVINGELHRGFQGASGELVRLPDVGHAWHGHPVAMISSPDERARDDARAVIRRAASGDERAATLVAEFFGEVGRLIAVIGWVLAPPVVVLGGGFAGVERESLDLLRRAMRTIDVPDLDIRVSSLSRDAPLSGGITLALDAAAPAVFGGP